MDGPPLQIEDFVWILVIERLTIDSKYKGRYIECISSHCTCVGGSVSHCWNLHDLERTPILIHGIFAVEMQPVHGILRCVIVHLLG